MDDKTKNSTRRLVYLALYNGVDRDTYDEIKEISQDTFGISPDKLLDCEIREYQEYNGEMFWGMF